MPDPSATQRARELIDELARGNGWISEQDRQYLSIHMPNDSEERRWRPQGSFLEYKSVSTITANSSSLGILSYDIRLSRNLYQKDTRFVYELIQNAEDNSYNIAKDEQVEPFLSFELSGR